MPKLTLFLDDGGVLNDNAVRAVQWQQLVGKFLAPIPGSTPEAWAEANRVTAPPLWQPDVLQALWEEAGREYSAFERTYQRRWLAGMCEHLGLEPPYERIFADAGVEPENAVVVDDNPQALAWAAQWGARTVLVRQEGARS